MVELVGMEAAVKGREEEEVVKAVGKLGERMVAWLVKQVGKGAELMEAAV